MQVMRYRNSIRIVIASLLLTFNYFSSDGQDKGRLFISGIILSHDSLPLPNVAIINTRTGKTVRTNSIGYFQTKIQPGDSLLAYHLSFQKMFITAASNEKILVMSPEIQELQPVDVVADSTMKNKEMDALEKNIVNLALHKRLEGYDKVSAAEYFYLLNGSHNKAISPFFGPTVSLNFDKIATAFSKFRERKQVKKITGHYYSRQKASPVKK